MAKTPRPSIADQLAAVAATRPRDDAQPPQRDDAPPSAAVERPAPALTTVESQPTPAAQPQFDAVTLPRRAMGTRKRGNETPDGMKVRQRIEKPHASLYAHPRVFKKLREIAAAEDCKAHDLYVEGLRLVLARYGYDLDKLERGEA